MKNRWFSLTGCAWVLVIALFISACHPTITPPPASSGASQTPAITPTPTQPPAVHAGSGYFGQGMVDKSWGSVSSLTSLSLLTVGAADSAILSNGWVKVNNSGKAKLYKPGVCTAVYVFYNSGIKTGSCTKSSTGSWSCVVGAAISQNCAVGIQTPAVTLTTNGTYYSVISTADGSLAIVTVLEGEVKVVPVVALNMQIKMTDQGPELPEIADADRVEDPNQAIVLGPGQSAYTAPDAYLDGLNQRLAARGIVDVPKPRQPLDAAQFQLLISRLVQEYPELQPYVDQVREQSTQDGFPFPINTRTLLLQAGGGFLEKADQRAVLLNGIEWAAVLKDAFPDQPVSFTYQFSDAQGSLTDQAYQPALARRLVEGNQLGAVPLFLIVQADDPALERVVRSLQGRFKEIGLQLEVDFVGAADMQSKYEVSVQSGVPAMILYWK